MKKIMILILGLLVGASFVKGEATGNNTILLIYLTDDSGDRLVSSDLTLTELKQFSATLKWNGETIDIPVGSTTNMFQFMAIGKNFALQISLQGFLGVVPLGAEMELTVTTNTGYVTKTTIVRAKPAGREDSEICVEPLSVDNKLLN